ncbi:MAG: hypothetical protein KME46_34170 [Brasilonema angustatum HA4187-MV1]|jgi:hypothetical protein|nr:hypothetical protein [Brasilonema angustatum HA4187-MV1]
MPKATDRQYINYLGEYYDDCLEIESVLKNRPKSAEAASLLSSKLQEREVRRNAMVQYLADKRGISFKEMWQQLLKKEYSPMTPEEFAQLEIVDEGS